MVVLQRVVVATAREGQHNGRAIVCGPTLRTLFAVLARVIIIRCTCGRCLVGAEEVATFFGIAYLVVGQVVQHVECGQQFGSGFAIVVGTQEAIGVIHVRVVLLDGLHGGQAQQGITHLALVAHKVGQFAGGIAQLAHQSGIGGFLAGQLDNLCVRVGRAADGGGPGAANDVAFFDLLRRGGVGGGVSVAFQGRHSGHFLATAHADEGCGGGCACGLLAELIAGIAQRQRETSTANRITGTRTVERRIVVGQSIDGLADNFYLDNTARNVFGITVVGFLAYLQVRKDTRPRTRIGQVVGQHIGEGLAEVIAQEDAHAAVLAVDVGLRCPC